MTSAADAATHATSPALTASPAAVPSDAEAKPKTAKNAARLKPKRNSRGNKTTRKCFRTKLNILLYREGLNKNKPKREAGNTIIQKTGAQNAESGQAHMPLARREKK